MFTLWDAIRQLVDKSLDLQQWRRFLAVCSVSVTFTGLAIRPSLRSYRQHAQSAYADISVTRESGQAAASP